MTLRPSRRLKRLPASASPARFASRAWLVLGISIWRAITKPTNANALTQAGQPTPAPIPGNRSRTASNVVSPKSRSYQGNTWRMKAPAVSSGSLVKNSAESSGTGAFRSLFPPRRSAHARAAQRRQIRPMRASLSRIDRRYPDTSGAAPALGPCVRRGIICPPQTRSASN